MSENTKRKLFMLVCALSASMLFQNCKKKREAFIVNCRERIKGQYINPPERLCSSSEGTLYFSSSYANKICQLTLAGDTTLMAILPNDGSGTRALRGLKTGENGTVYAVLIKTNQVVKIDRKKRINYIPVSIGLNQPNDLAIAPDSTFRRTFFSPNLHLLMIH